MIKKIVSISLVFVMLLGAFSVQIFADGSETPREPVTYFVYEDMDFTTIISLEEATASEGALEVTKIYPGDVIKFYNDSTSSITTNVTYTPGADAISASFANNLLYQAKGKVSQVPDINNATVFDINDTFVRNNITYTIDFVTKEGNYDFLYWIVFDENDIRFSGSSNYITFMAVWDVPEQEEDDEKPDQFSFILNWLEDMNDELMFKPFFNALKKFVEIYREIYTFFNNLLEPVVPVPEPEVPTEEVTEDYPEATTVPAY